MRWRSCPARPAASPGSWVCAPVSFTPYLDQLQKILDNQYLITFAVAPGKKAGPQFVNLSTEIPGVDLNAADAVWVPAAK